MRGLTLLGADGLPVKVMVEDLASIVELRGGRAIVVGLHNDLQMLLDCLRTGQYTEIHSSEHYATLESQHAGGQRWAAE